MNDHPEKRRPAVIFIRDGNITITPTHDGVSVNIARKGNFFKVNLPESEAVLLMSEVEASLEQMAEWQDEQ